MNLSNVPWWAGLLGMVVSSAGTYLASSKASSRQLQSALITANTEATTTLAEAKEHAQSELVTQTVLRQNQLDARQGKMMDELQLDIGRLRDELILVRKELIDERAVNRALETAMEVLKCENRQLKLENEALKAQVAEFTKALSKFAQCEVSKCDKLVVAQT